jgi:hypothetical protein
VVVSHLVGCYQSTALQSSLAPVIAGASKEVKAFAKEDLAVDAALAKDVPWFW